MTATDGDVLEFSHLDTGAPDTLVALACHEGRVVVAIVHPQRTDGLVPWSLAGDVDRANRPMGAEERTVTAMAEAARALEQELGITVAGVSVRA